jgi:hypothetical protein
MKSTRGVDQEELFVVWGDSVAHGFIDGVPDGKTLMDPAHNNSTRQHRVRRPSGREFGIATYRLRSNTKEHYTDLDYGGSLTQGNVDAGMEIGVMRLRFDGNLVVAVEWGDLDEEPTQAAAIALRRAELKQLNAAWNLINEGKQ